MAQENVNSNDVSELSRLSSQELETQLQQAVKDKDQKRVMEIFAEQNKRNPDTVMVEENKSILEKYKAFMEKYHKEGNFGDKRDEFVKFFQNDIKTYKSNMETQHTNLEDARNKQLSTLMGLLDEKDTQIADLTKERDEALNVLPKAGEIF
ncbi:MAG: hypothetical protein LBG59_03460 [Candidatus Peribacteria bacterium]|jgi:hypothetical protein|nr:hypothetical protein [Candidatus Peribacteria bacterium]